MHMLLLFLSCVVFLIDQAVKFGIVHILYEGEVISVVSQFFDITYIRNTGGAWGLFQNATGLLFLASLIFLGAFFVYLRKHPPKKKLEVICYSLLIGGILGNAFDRLVHQYVIDYLSFTIFDYHFPIFNFADMAIVGGLILMLVDMIGSEIYERRNQKR